MVVIRAGSRLWANHNPGIRQVPALGWLQIVGFAGIVELNAGTPGDQLDPQNDRNMGRKWRIHHEK